MRSSYAIFRTKALELRLLGKTYREIRTLTGAEIPKSTLSDWFNSGFLGQDQKNQIKILTKINLARGAVVARTRNKTRRVEYLRELNERNLGLEAELQNLKTAKIALAVLYLGEGAKTRRGALAFGNSDAGIIRLFISLLKRCYSVDLNKFRCTVQCRADQDVWKLEDYWIKVTGIPREQFLRAQIDPRTAGKPTKKPGYKGVCRIDYYSADVYNEIMSIPGILYKSFS